ncbi:ubiquitin [Trifolium pratense]|uniref:Ubiquitin n=1 Tax=Trifolium pratense TaxID=57577 RepID=A0A2K3LQK2_TRIPR|nr:ubiquitin [Trifolium pratense]
MVRKRSRRSNAANNSAFLPMELIGGILAQLSVKDIVRFKCVSKSWETITSDPNFVDKHLKMKIFIKSGRRPFTLSVNCLDTIIDVKKKIFEEKKIPVHQQVLMFNNENLRDNMTLASYNIQENSTLREKSTLNLRRRMMAD